MYKTIFMALIIGIITAVLISSSIGVTYGQGSGGSGMQIFVSPQDRNEDDSKDKVREIIDKVKGTNNNDEKENDARDTIEKFKERDNSDNDGPDNDGDTDNPVGNGPGVGVGGPGGIDPGEDGEDGSRGPGPGSLQGTSPGPRPTIDIPNMDHTSPDFAQFPRP